jgi:aminoglycoside 3-N-acetyltransferase I
MIAYERLRAGDIKVMRAMNAMFGQAFEDAATYSYERGSDDYLRRVLGREHLIALAARERDRVVGGLVAYVLEKLEGPHSEIYLYDLAVDETFRRRGIATQLIELLRAIAAELGAWVIFVQADLQDRPAVALYEKLGIREEPLHFDIKV